MAITLQQARFEATKDALKREVLEREIDAHFIDRYRADPNRCNVQWSIPEKLLPARENPVVQALMNTYGKAGWNVKIYRDDPRNPPYLEFTPKEE